MPLYRSFVDFVSNQVIGGIKNFTQNLGLGISTPQAKLHIDSGDAAASNIKFTAGVTTGQSATDGFDVGIDNSGNGIINQRAAKILALATSSATRLSINSSGTVSIVSAIASTASNNGALVLTNGGLGVSGAINAGGDIIAPANIISPTFRAIDVTSGSNLPGNNLTIRPGAGRGSGTLSNIIFRTPDTAGSDAAPQTTTEKMRLSGAGNLLIGTTTDNNTDKLQVNGSIIATQFRQSTNSTPPASATATGTLGEIRIDSNFIYYCFAANQWKRAALSTW